MYIMQHIISSLNSMHTHTVKSKTTLPLQRAETPRLTTTTVQRINTKSSWSTNIYDATSRQQQPAAASVNSTRKLQHAPPISIYMNIYAYNSSTANSYYVVVNAAT